MTVDACYRNKNSLEHTLGALVNDLALRYNKTPLYETLSTYSYLALFCKIGSFSSRNVFLRPKSRKVRFISFSNFSLAADSITAERSV